MAVLFSTAPGQVVRLISPLATPMTLTVDRWQGFTAAKSIVTGIQISRRSNIQYMQTLQDFVYAYIFGERLGNVTLTGLAFSNNCGQSTKTGPESILEYYEKYRASKLGRLLTIQLGNSSAGRFRCFLVGLDMVVDDPAQQLTKWTLTFSSLPNESFKKADDTDD